MFSVDRQGIPVSVFSVLAFFVNSGVVAMEKIEYPESRRGAFVDNYHGTEVSDPYRWLEDLDGEETQDWIDAQNALTGAFLKQVPVRDGIEERLTSLWNFPKYGMPRKEGQHYYFWKNDGLQRQNVYYQSRTFDGEEARVFLDPNTFSEDGTVALSGLYFSEDGSYVVYSKSKSGSDWRSFHIRNVETGEDLPDRLEWIKFSGASWAKDGSGFFYSRYDKPAEGDEYEGINKFNKLYFHKLGDSQEEDVLIYERPDDPEIGIGAFVSDDGNFLILSLWKGTDRRNRFYYKDLRKKDSKIVALLDAFDASYDFVGNVENHFYILTDLDAERKRLVKVDIGQPERANWEDIIPESSLIIESVSMVNKQFVVRVLEHAVSRLRIHSLEGALEKEVVLPTLGSVDYVRGKQDGTEMFYSFDSFLYPKSIYRYDFVTGESSSIRDFEVDFDPKLFESRQVFYRSKDGTRVPMFITHRRGLKLDGSNPTLLYGYGGFNINIKPFFSISNLVWFERGGVLAVPNLRGGGEYGEAWHQAGMLEKKQNVFDDFIGAAEHLIEQGYTVSNKLAIAGGSNGGLLTAACSVQRPDLFQSVIVAVGVLDMLRYHKFTIGWAWVSEYGSSDDPQQFAYLYRYSPLHNLKSGTSYPATLIMTSDHDDRVVPGHSYKYAAAIQQAQAGNAPVLIRIERKAGHGAGRPTDKIIKSEADKWAFLIRTLWMD